MNSKKFKAKWHRSQCCRQTCMHKRCTQVTIAKMKCIEGTKYKTSEHSRRCELDGWRHPALLVIKFHRSPGAQIEALRQYLLCTLGHNSQVCQCIEESRRLSRLVGTPTQKLPLFFYQYSWADELKKEISDWRKCRQGPRISIKINRIDSTAGRPLRRWMRNPHGNRDSGLGWCEYHQAVTKVA